jgi:hypothetical protein
MVLFFLVGFGAVLRKKTHHHGLAGATFGLVALAFAAIAALVAVRFARALTEMRAPLQRIALGVTAAVLLAGVLLLGNAVARSGTARTQLGPWVVDAVALCFAGTLASRTSFERLRMVSFLAPPVAVVFFALSLSLVRSRAELRQTLHARAPAYVFVGGPLVPGR